MEYIGIVLSIAAIIIAWFKKEKKVDSLKKDSTETRIKNIEDAQSEILKVLNNYDLKAKK